MGFIKPTFKDWILDFQFKSIFFNKWHICILLGMYIVAFFIGFLFWKSCKFWRRLMALDYIWKSGVGFTLFYFTNLFVEILGRKGSGTMIFYSELVLRGVGHGYFYFILAGLLPPWWHHTGIELCECRKMRARILEEVFVKRAMSWIPAVYWKMFGAWARWCVLEGS